MSRADQAIPAILDPRTTERGAFSAARELGLVEVHEGQPIRTQMGEAAFRRLRGGR